MKLWLASAFCLAFLGSQMTVRAAVVMTENFEDSTVDYVLSDGSGNVLSEVSDGAGDFYGIVGIGGISVGGFYQINNVQGSGFFAAMDTDAEPPNTDTVVLTWSGISVGGMSNIEFGGFFGEDDDGTAQDWDSNSSVLVEASIDGGGFVNVFAIEAEAGSNFNTVPRVDTDFDGVGDGTEITDSLTQFTSAIAGVGNLLDLRLTISNLNAGDEDIAFDNITISATAVPEPSSLAVLAICGSLALRRRQRK